MVAAIALDRIATIVAAIGRIVGTERAQPIAGEQLPADRAEYLCSLGTLHKWKRQGQREHLVRPQREVIAPRRIHDIGEPIPAGLPEPAEKRRASLIRQLSVGRRGLVVPLLQEAHEGTYRVVPEGIDLHGLTNTRCDDPLADFGVHPR